MHLVVVPIRLPLALNALAVLNTRHPNLRRGHELYDVRPRQAQVMVSEFLPITGHKIVMRWALEGGDAGCGHTERSLGTLRAIYRQLGWSEA